MQKGTLIFNLNQFYADEFGEVTGVNVEYTIRGSIWSYFFRQVDRKQGPENYFALMDRVMSLKDF